MKKLLKIITIIIASSLILSSCGKKMYIAKRKYNKGFYVNHSGKKSEVKPQKSTAKVYNKKAENISYNPEIQNPVVKTEPIITAEVSKPVTSPLNQTVNKKSAKPNFFNSRDIQIKQLENIIPQKYMTKDLKKKLSSSAAGDALSLIWIIILVIILIYLLSFLFDGFGLGGAVHLLALIALILLILWLLRVI